MEITVRIPENLSIADLLKATGLVPSRKLIDKIAFICYSLHCSEAGRRNAVEKFHGDIQHRPYSPLYSVILRRYFNDYNKILDLLIKKLKVIETDKRFIIGKKSTGYRFSEAYFGVKFVDHEIQDLPLYRKLKTYFGENNLEVHIDKTGVGGRYSFLKKYWNRDKLKIDKPAALNWINRITDCILRDFPGIIKFDNVDSNSPSEVAIQKKKVIENRELLITLIDRFDKGQFYFTVDNSEHRLHTNLTNIKNEARNYISYDNQKLVALDIKNSSLYFLLALFNKNFWIERKRIPRHQLSLQRIGILHQFTNKEIEDILYTIMLLETPEIPVSKGFREVDFFTNVVTKGVIYDDALADYKKETEKTKNRQQVKSAFLTYLFYNPADERDYSGNNLVSYISSYYPQITCVLNAIKKNDYKILAKILRRIESYLVIEVTCKQLSKDFIDAPIFTIHDSIITTEKYAASFQAVIEQELGKFIGHKPPIKQEIWQPTPDQYKYGDLEIVEIHDYKLTPDNIYSFFG